MDQMSQRIFQTGPNCKDFSDMDQISQTGPNFKDLWIKCLHGNFGQEQILRTLWDEPSVSVDVLYRIKCVLILGPVKGDIPVCTEALRTFYFVSDLYSVSEMT